MRRAVAVVALVGGVLLAACGDPGGAVATATPAPVADRVASSADPTLAGDAVAAFGTDLYAAVAAGTDPGDNIVVSPLSVAVALAMVEPGAVDESAAALHAALGIDDPAAFHASMNALTTGLADREPESFVHDADVEVDLADAAYIQRGYPLTDAYLDAVGRDYGPALDLVDFTPDPDAVAHRINDFVAGVTHDRIPELVADGVLDPGTKLALVNALYLKAGWLAPFAPDDTVQAPFTRDDGSTVDVPMMHGLASEAGRGDGWTYVRLDLAGRMAAELVLPDEGRVEEVAAHLDDVVPECTQAGNEVALPRFEARSSVDLIQPFERLGLGPLRAGGLDGIADDPSLVLDSAVHEGWIAVDEEGIEAAAATEVGFAASGCLDLPADLTFDRPFLFRVVDLESGAPLFVGRVMDPTAG